ncbi:MAG: hypothetical protein Q4D41_09920 [Prevotellaceae bacterium]|nr:hypothetical protein [Prevotellaceae bacterium]
MQAIAWLAELMAPTKYNQCPQRGKLSITDMQAIAWLAELMALTQYNKCPRRGQTLSNRHASDSVACGINGTYEI